MYRYFSQLLMYRDLSGDSILSRLTAIFEKAESENCNKPELISELNTQLNRLLVLATDYGFDDNLWHNYVTFYIIMNENPFSIVSEKAGKPEGSVNELVRNDFRLLKNIFDYDFSDIESKLSVRSFSVMSDYHAVRKNPQMFNRNVSEKVRNLSKALESAETAEAFADKVADFYKAYGVGMFGLNKAFRISEKPDGNVGFIPINNMDEVQLDDLVGYELQKEKLLENTDAFVRGKRANNVLLYGDIGTGKSTSIKAIVNRFYDNGLRMIEIYKHQFKYLSAVIAAIKNRNYKFVIYMDDLSFEEHEIEYKFLKAVIEGGVETRPDNILIYATSNRRHLIKETWNDKNDTGSDDLHHSDTVEEKLSLASRFGVTIYYGKPMQREYVTIVTELARREGISMPDDELALEAKRWEMHHGGLSGRTARQFVNYLLGREQ